MKRTELSELGEFGLINRINQHVKIYHPDTIKGIGDDAAVLAKTEDTLTLVSSDMLIEGIHFDLTYFPLKHLGYKAVAVNVSDIAAMNGLPKQMTISLGVSNRFPVEAIDELYEGIRLACENYHIDLIGGDTTATRSGLTLAVTLIGEVKKEAIAYRSGAKPNDIVCVSGDLGAAYMGLQILEREKQVFKANPEMQPDLETHAYLIGKQLKPDGRTDIIHELMEKGIVPTSMIDISDGLAAEVLHLCHASEVGIAIFEENLPIENATMLAATEFKLNPITVALHGGEEYELLMTIRQEDYEKLKTITELTPIGFVNDSKAATLILNSGDHAAIQAPGWQAIQPV